MSTFTVKPSLPRYTPSWSSGAFITRIVPVVDSGTAFGDLVEKLGLANQPAEWRHNRTIRAFVKRNYKHRYIPESLLGELGLEDGNWDLYE